MIRGEVVSQLILDQPSEVHQYKNFDFYKYSIYYIRINQSGLQKTLQQSY